MHEQLGVTRPPWMQKGYTPTPKKKPQSRATTRSPSPASSGSLPATSATTDLPGMLLFGAVPNLFLLYHLLTLEPKPSSLIYQPTTWNIDILTAATIFVAVNCFRCCFPNKYRGNVVLHDTPLSSIMLTRTLATFSEMAHFFTLSVVALEMNTRHGEQAWIATGASALPVLCAAAQCLVWSSLLLETDSLVWWEEALWAAMYAVNTLINASFYAAGQSSGGELPLVTLSIVFGCLYLPWQCGLHLPSISSRKDPPMLGAVTWERLKRGAAKAAFEMNPSKDAEKWGGAVGAVWMTSYWILLPWWMVLIADNYSDGSPNVVTQLSAMLGY